MLLMYQW